jgi:hypothetical protein
MEHAEAQQMRAVERYALGDLSVSEVEDFERHFFDCPQCSEELRLLCVLQDNARAVFIEQSSAPSLSPATTEEPVATPAKRPQAESPARTVRWWQGWAVAWPALAMLVVAVFLGYQAGERKTGEPQAVNAYPLHSPSRGTEALVSPATGAQFYTLYMDRSWDTDFASYRAVVRDDPGHTGQGAGQSSGAGSERISMPLAKPEQGGTIYVLLPAHALPGGRYVIQILGKDASGAESTAAEYTFTLRFPVN